MTVLLKVLADAPGIVVSAVLWLMLLAQMPAALAWPTLGAGCVALSTVAAGRLEGPMVRLMAHARVLTEAETAVLSPVLTRLCSLGVGPPPTIAVYMRRAAGPYPAVEPMGHACVVSRGLVQAVHWGRLDAEGAAAMLTHAVGRLHHGHNRLDLAVLFCTAPWRLLAGVCRRVGGAMRWVPFLGLAWRLRGGVATVAVVQSVAAGRTGSALVIAVFVAATYAVPRCRRAWARRVERAADEFVVAHSLGEALSRLLQRRTGGVPPLERIHRLRAATPTSPQLTVVRS